VIIHDFHSECVTAAPGKTDPPLVVDPDAEIAGSIALQHFQPVPRRRAEVLQPLGLVQIQKLPARSALDGLESPDEAVVEKPGCVGALERPYQALVYDVWSIMSNVMEAASRKLRRAAH
jgi:hypothetical protein